VRAAAAVAPLTVIVIVTVQGVDDAQLALTVIVDPVLVAVVVVVTGGGSGVVGAPRLTLA
jgi:hypothetical protein